MTEKTDLDEATDERNRIAQRFADYWEKTSDLNRVLFNLEMDKIHSSAKIQNKRYQIIDKINSLEKDHKQSYKFFLIFTPVWAVLIAGYIFFYQDSGDKFITFVVVFGILSISNTIKFINYNNQKNSLSESLDIISALPEYDLQSAWLSTKPHWLFKYYNHDFSDDNGRYSEIEKIKIETQVEKFRLRLLIDIENDIYNSKSMIQRDF